MAIHAVLQYFSEPFNLFTDSAYIAQTIPKLETASQSLSTTWARQMFAQIQALIQARHNPFAIIHVRAHSGLPGPLGLGNQTIDEALVALAQETPIQKA